MLGLTALNFGRKKDGVNPESMESPPPPPPLEDSSSSIVYSKPKSEKKAKKSAKGKKSSQAVIHDTVSNFKAQDMGFQEEDKQNNTRSDEKRKKKVQDNQNSTSDKTDLNGMNQPSQQQIVCQLCDLVGHIAKSCPVLFNMQMQLKSLSEAFNRQNGSISPRIMRGGNPQQLLNVPRHVN